MTTYIVMTDGSPGMRETLLDACTKVGKPGPMGKLFIVESDAPIHTLETIPGVVDVEEDGELTPDELDEPDVQTQKNPENWFLRALSQDEDNYTYTRTGEGVDLYIVDSGIWYHHDEFEDRVVNLWSFDNEAYGSGMKSPHHGTMCAGCAGGKEHGVAKRVTLYNLRVNWTTANGLKAMDVILKHHLEKGDDRPSIVSMSFSTKNSYAYRYAMQQLIDHGVVCMASTGNYREAEARFPAGNDIVMGVSCLRYMYDDVNRLYPAPYTNYGKGTDVWAPGHNGTVAAYEHQGTQNANGTSAACPVAAGIMAMYLEGSRKPTTRQEVVNILEGFRRTCMRPFSLEGKYSDTLPLVTTSLFDHPVVIPHPIPEPPKPSPTPEPDPEPVPVPKKENREKTIKKYLPAALTTIAVAVIMYLIVN